MSKNLYRAKCETFGTTLKFISSNLQGQKVFYSFVAIQMFLYSPYLIKINVQNDDFNYFVPEKELFSIHPQFKFLILLGRPIAAIIVGLQNLLVWDVVTLMTIRVASIVLISVIGKMIYEWVKAQKLGKLSYATTLLVILLPGFSFMVNLTIATPYLLPIFISLYIVKKTWSADLSQSSNLKTHHIRLSYVLMFLFSLCIYQPTTMFFVPLIVVAILGSTPRELPNQIKRSIVVTLNFLIASVLYFITIKLVLISYFEKKWPLDSSILYSIGNGMYKIKLNFNLISIVNDFRQEILPKGMNLWNIYGTNAFTLLTVFLVISAAVIFGRRGSFESRRHILRKIIITIVCLLASNLPNLLASGGYIANRTLLPFQTTLVIIICSLVAFIINTSSLLTRIGFGSLLLLISAVAPLSSFGNAYTTAVNNEIQIKYTRDSLESVPEGVVDFVPADSSRSYLGLRSINDEFNFNSSAYYLLLTIAAKDPWLGKPIGNFSFNFSGEMLDHRSLIDLSKIQKNHKSSKFERILVRLTKLYSNQE